MTTAIVAATHAFITAEQAAAEAGVSVYTINRWCREYGTARGGKGFTTRVLRYGRRIHAVEFQRWIETKGPVSHD